MPAIFCPKAVRVACMDTAGPFLCTERAEQAACPSSQTAVPFCHTLLP